MEEARCVICSKPATLRCPSCIDGVDYNGHPFAIHYCSVPCLESDLPTHEQNCKIANNHKQLYRTGELLQQLFYVYREKGFDIDVALVAESGGKMHVYEAPPVKGKALVPFPHVRFPKSEDKLAMLAWFACAESLALTHELLCDSLAGISTKLMEVGFAFTSGKARIHFHETGLKGELLTDSWHQMFGVTLDGGASYAVDLTGTQFGRLRTVTPWGEHKVELRGVSEIEIAPLGTYTAVLRTGSLRIGGREVVDTETKKPKTRRFIRERVNETVKVWVGEWYENGLLGLPQAPAEEEYAAGLAALMADVTAEGKAFIAYMRPRSYGPGLDSDSLQDFRRRYAEVKRKVVQATVRVEIKGRSTAEVEEGEEGCADAKSIFANEGAVLGDVEQRLPGPSI